MPKKVTFSFLFSIIIPSAENTKNIIRFPLEKCLI